LRLVPLLVVAALELLGLLLLAGAALVAAWTYVGLWAGLLAAGVVVLGGSWLGAQPHGAGGAEGLDSWTGTLQRSCTLHAPGRYARR
jgi:hypothetical protein